MIRIIDQNFTAEGLSWKRFVPVIAEGSVNGMSQNFVQSIMMIHSARLLALEGRTLNVEGCVSLTLFNY
jgi:hypothetical protein